MYNNINYNKNTNKLKSTTAARAKNQTYTIKAAAIKYKNLTKGSPKNLFFVLFFDESVKYERL